MNPPSKEELAARYQRSADFEARIKGAYVEPRITPYWIGQSSTFWYRLNVGPGQASFIFVNAENGERSSAFDHEKLAQALKSRGIQATPTTLPFTWIKPSVDRTSTKFRVKATIWDFRSDGTLIEHHGRINEEFSKPMRKERRSEATHSKTTITFVNETKRAVSLFWINHDGKAVFCVTVKAGKSNTRPTCVEHVWRVADSETKELIASFVAKSDGTTAVIEEAMSSETQAIDGSAEDDASEDSDNASSGETQPFSGVFVKDYNVWSRDADGQETQLSTSGTQDNPFDGDKVHPSFDRRFVVVYQYTPEQKHTVHKVESSPKDHVQPRLIESQYLKPGDKIRMDRPRMFNLTEKKEVDTDDSLFKNPYEILDMGWNAADNEYHFHYNQRGHQIIRVLGIDTKGSVRTLIQETSSTFLDYDSKRYWHGLEKSAELIWTSERDGWHHLYLFDLGTGTMKNQITSGEWAVRSVDKVDEDKKQIWLTAFGKVQGQDPYYAQLVRVNFDGSNLTVLTDGDGTHTWKWSPDRRYLIDTWSRVDSAPMTVLRDGETGRHIVTLEKGEIQKLMETGWRVPELFNAPGRDGKSTIYGIMIRPSDFDPSHKYPVIEEIYAGPPDFSVPKAFSTLTWLHELAELGFIVVMIDGMGTNWRSKAFQDVCHENLKDAGFPDRIAWMKAAVESRPWMDLSRVGIYGGSAGGQSAMGALLWHGDIYKAAVADCGCHDNRMDKLWWNEQWMGWPVDKSYEDSSNVVHAHRLTGALMLTVGELDDNVDPASTMQVINALNEAEKDYELVFFPGAGHGIGSRSEYAIRRQRDFFVRHLIGVEPPWRNGR